jgi:hypothetical protein
MRKRGPYPFETHVAEKLIRIQWILEGRNGPDGAGPDGKQSPDDGGVDLPPTPGLPEAREAAKEVLRALVRGAEDLGPIDRKALEDACRRVAYDEQFGILLALPSRELETIEYAELILTDPKRKISEPPQNPEKRKPVIPPCPKGVGADTHDRLWKALPEAGWFRTGDISKDKRVRVSETTVRVWCHAMKARYLEHNGETGKGSLYRRRPK